MSAFLDSVKARAKQDKKTIVLPESMDRRTFEAAATVLKEGIADLVIVGSPEEVAKYGEGLDLTGATFIDPATSDKTEGYIQKLVELRQKKGMTYDQAKALILGDYMYFACMMVKMGEADGVVSGACHSTANTRHRSSELRVWRERRIHLRRFRSGTGSESGRAGRYR